MQRNIRRSITVLILTLVVAAVAMASPHNRYGSSYWPDVTLTDQNGKQVKFYDDLIKGKIVVIDFFYTQCKDACPLETARLRQVQKDLGDRVG
jgi:protein SCO1/2